MAQVGGTGLGKGPGSADAERICVLAMGPPKGLLIQHGGPHSPGNCVMLATASFPALLPEGMR